MKSREILCCLVVLLLLPSQLNPLVTAFQIQQYSARDDPSSFHDVFLEVGSDALARENVKEIETSSAFNVPRDMLKQDVVSRLTADPEIAYITSPFLDILTSGKGSLLVRVEYPDGTLVPTSELNALVLYWDSSSWVLEPVPGNPVYIVVPAPDDYTVEAYVNDMYSGSGWAHVEPGESVPVPITTFAQGKLRIRALCSDGGTPLSGAFVEVVSHEDMVWRDGYTGGDGWTDWFDLQPTNVPPATGEYYKAKVYYDGYERGRSGEITFGIGKSKEVDVPTDVSPPKGAIKVTTKDYYGNLLSVESLLLYDVDWNILGGKIDPSNPFTFSNLSPGTYHVEAYIDDMFIGSAENIIVEPGQTTERTIQAQWTKKTLKVTVYYNDGSTVFPSAEVKLSSWHGPDGPWNLRQTKTTNNNGETSFSAWPTTKPGEKYKVEVFHDAKKVGWKDPVYVDKNTGADIEITTTEPPPPPEKGAIAITTKDYYGNLLSVESLLLYDVDWNILGGKIDPSNPFTFSNLSPGTYHVEAYIDAMFIGSKENIEVKPDQTEEVTLYAFWTTETLKVTVYYSDGTTRFPHVTVKVYSWDGTYTRWNYRYSDETDGNGEVEFSLWPTTKIDKDEKYKVEVVHNSEVVGSKDPVYVDKNTGGAIPITTTVDPPPPPKGAIKVTTRDYYGNLLSVESLLLYDKDWNILGGKKDPSNPFTFQDLSPGTYHVEAYIDDMFIGSKEDIPVTSDQTEEEALYAFWLKTSLKITVYYYDSVTSFPDATVEVYSWNGNYSRWNYRNASITDDNGQDEFYVWPTTKSGEKYKVEVFYNSELVGSQDPVYVEKDAGADIDITTTVDRFYRIDVLFGTIAVENSGVLQTYLQISDWNEAPINGISIQLQTALGDRYLTSERYLGVDGIIHDSFDLSAYAGEVFEIYVPEQSFNSIPIVPPSPNPIAYNLLPRESKLSFGTTQSCSASAILKTEGSYGQTFTISNDGYNIFSFNSFDESQMGVGVELTPFEAKLGVIRLEATTGTEAGLSAGLGYDLSDPAESTQKQLMKNLITRWILTNIIALSPSGSVPRTLAEAARLIIDWENSVLGIDDYCAIEEFGGWSALSASAGVWLGIQSERGRARGLGPALDLGAGGDTKFEAGIHVYPTMIGFYGNIRFRLNIGAGMSLNLGFLSAESNVELNTWGSVGAELLFDKNGVFSIEFDFQLGIQADAQAVLAFSGLAEPLEDLAFSPDQSKTRTLHLHFSIPADKLTENLIEYLDSMVYGTIDPDMLWQKLVQALTEVPVAYEVSVEYESDISIPIGATIGGIGFELEWGYRESSEFTVEEGFFYGMQKWPIAVYNTPPGFMDTSSFILNNWIYDGDSPQPSGTAVRLDETEGKLYLHVYDSEGRHVGTNYQTSEIETEVPEAYYFDNVNGTIVVVLPSDISDFEVSVDAKYAEEINEAYNLTVAILTRDIMNETILSSMVDQGSIQGYDVAISYEGEIVVNLDTDPPGIFILSPQNQTYTVNDVFLSFAVDESASWIGYCLDEQTNVTVSGDTILSVLSEGSHRIIIYANDTAGNMGSSDTVHFAIDIVSPSIEILSPQNVTYTASSVSLNFTIDEATPWIAYNLDGHADVTIAGNTTIVGLPDGTHIMIVYASDTAGNMGYSDTVYFTIDTVLPDIEIFSPKNKTYTNSSISLSFTVDEGTSWIGYSLDGQANVTITGNVTLSGLPDGSHSLIVYANDAAGNIGTSEIIYFSIEIPQPERARRAWPLSIWLGVLSVATLAMAIAISIGRHIRTRKYQEKSATNLRSDEISEFEECTKYLMDKEGLNKADAARYCKMLGKRWHELTDSNKDFP